MRYSLPTYRIRDLVVDMRPTYQIPVRELVAGMCGVGSGPHGARAVAGIREYWRGHPDGLVGNMFVMLPGPSPRELACTCWEDALGHDAEYLWEDESIRQHGERCAEYAQRRAEIANDAQTTHAADCPVAPVPGRHGGMRLWPAPFRGMPWDWNRHSLVWLVPHGPSISAHCLLDDLPAGLVAPATADVLWQCFYLPPASQPERRPAPACDPYGTDLDLAVRYG